MKKLLTLSFGISIILGCQNTGTNTRVGDGDTSAIGVVPLVQKFASSNESFTIPTDKITVGFQNDVPNTFTENYLRDIQAIVGKNVSVATSPDFSKSTIQLNIDTNLDLGQSSLSEFQKKQGYQLKITDSNLALTARSLQGLVLGSQTLLQLFAVQKNTNTPPPAGTITDWPSYQERSVMLDVGRKFFAVDTIKRLIRLAAYYKMNTVHLHFTDWNAFRLNDEKNYKGLAPAPDANRNPQAYTQDDINTILGYADTYGVTIIPEIDIPAHSSAIVKYFKNTHKSAVDLGFSSDTSCHEVDTFKVDGPTSTGWTLDVTNPKTFPAIKALVGNFMDWFQEYKDAHPNTFQNKYFHLGGDEWPTNQVMNKCQTLKTACENNSLCDCPNNILPLSKCAIDGSEKYAPGGLFVDFMNQLQGKLFQNSNSPQMRMWTGWNAAYRMKDSAKYGLSSVDPAPGIVIDAWLVKQDLSHILTYNYLTNNTSYQLTYLTPGSAFDMWDYPPPQTFLYNKWDPKAFVLKKTPTLLNRELYDTSKGKFLGSGLQIWADGADKRPDGFFETLWQRPLQLIANATWANKPANPDAHMCDTRTNPLYEILTPFVTKIKAIGEPPRYALPTADTLNYSKNTLTVPAGKPVPVSSTLIDDIPVPWTLSATITLDSTLGTDDYIRLITSPIGEDTILNQCGAVIDPKTLGPNSILPPQVFSIDLNNPKGGLGYTNGVQMTKAILDPDNGNSQGICRLEGVNNFGPAKPALTPRKSASLVIVGDRSGLTLYLNGAQAGDTNPSLMSLPMKYWGSVCNKTDFTLSNISIKNYADYPK